MKRMAVVAGLLGVLLGGCASMQPLSSYARSGDTVTISLGGTESNALVPVLKKENIAVAITDAAGFTYPVKVRNVMRVYADPTSYFEFDNLKAGFSGSNYAAYPYPHQGLWLAVIDLVDPLSNQPPPLAAGPASLGVSSPDIRNRVDYAGWGWNWTNGDLGNIPLEILAGSGSINPVNTLGPVSFAPLDKLEAAEQIEIRGAGLPGGLIGGASFLIQYVNASFKYPPRPATTSPDPNVQFAWSRTDQGDCTSVIAATLVNPHGFTVTNARSGIVDDGVNSGKSLFDDLRFSVFWDDPAVGIDAASLHNHINLVSALFFDINGQVMPGMRATVAKVK
jgi:hypothetical protein